MIKDNFSFGLVIIFILVFLSSLLFFILNDNSDDISIDKNFSENTSYEIESQNQIVEGNYSIKGNYDEEEAYRVCINNYYTCLSNEEEEASHCENLVNYGNSYKQCINKYYYVKAVQSRNISYCENLIGERKSPISCEDFVSAVIDGFDENFCENVLGSSDDVYYCKSIMTLNSDYCDRISDFSMGLECKFFTKSFNCQSSDHNLDYCESIRPESI